MTPILVAFVLTSATLTFGARIDDVPPYVTYKTDSDNALEELNKHLIIDGDGDITDPNRHYVVIVNSILVILQTLLKSDSNYDDIYLPSIDNAVPAALEDPATVVNVTQTILAKIRNGTLPLRTLMKTTCLKEESEPECNQIIDEEVRADPNRLGHASDLLIAAGKLSATYNDEKASEFADAAAQYQEIPYLLKSQETLHPFIQQALDLTNLLD